MEQQEYLPISMLNQFEYCPRRFWYMHVLGEMDVNVPVLEGTYQHEKAHEAGASREGETTTHRRVYVWSDRLRIAGYADVIESFDKAEDGEANGVLVPIEYKHGRMGRWLNDHIQLCAQALCIEERRTTLIPSVRDGAAPGPSPYEGEGSIEYGEIFYWGSRRRECVEFTPELRARTEASIAWVYALLAQNVMPAPIEQRAKCKDCSLQPICLPDEVSHLVASAHRQIGKTRPSDRQTKRP